MPRSSDPRVRAAVSAIVRAGRADLDPIEAARDMSRARLSTSRGAGEAEGKPCAEIDRRHEGSRIGPRAED
jgi:hypothetical protein